MTGDRKTTRQRMISATAQSMRRRGLAGTSFTEVLADSGAARGAIYHHFPGGKAQLAEEAVNATGAAVGAALSELPATGGEAAIVDAFLALVRPVVEESAAGAGCVVASVVNESAPGDALQLVAREVLENWNTSLAEALVRAGTARRRADELASLLLVTLEGAHVLCRAAGNMGPFDRAAAALRPWTTSCPAD